MSETSTSNSGNSYRTGPAKCPESATLAVMSSMVRRPSKITIPERCHPLAKVTYAEMKRQNIGYEELEHRSGVLRSTFKAWRTNNRPGLDTIEAALGSLGWHVLPVPRPETLPPELRADLEAVAAKHCTTLPCLEFIAAAVGYRRSENIVPDELKRAA